MKTIVIVLLSALASSSTAMGAQVDTLNTFTAGTKAKAADVNNNFNELKFGVNNNDVRITNNANEITINSLSAAENAAKITTLTGAQSSLGVYVNNVRIGAYLSSSILSFLAPSTPLGDPTDTSVVSIDTSSLEITQKHMLFLVLLQNGNITTVAPNGQGILSTGITYKSPDCSGQAYATFPNNSLQIPQTIIDLNDFFATQGIVFSGRDPGSTGMAGPLTEADLFYTAPNTTPEQFTAGGLYELFTEFGCLNISSLGIPPDVELGIYPAFPNDKNVTGVDLSDLTGKIRLGF